MQSTRHNRAALNGRTRKTGVSAAPASASGPAPARNDDDPMSKVLGLDAETSGFAAWFGFTSGSTVLLGSLMAIATILAWVHTVNARSVALTTEEIDVMKEDVPPAPPPPERDTKVDSPPPRALPHEAPPPPAPAQAAKILAQEPDPNDPVDLTGYTIVQGNGDQFAGGFTTSTGKNTSAVKSAPAPSGVAGGVGPPGGIDRSRGCSLEGGAEWSCPFPQEADTVQIDEAYVTLQVDVRTDGTPASVRVVADPGNGFGREARRCAMAKRYQVALDRDGSPASCSFKVRVHFGR